MNFSFKKTKKKTETPGSVRMLTREEITDEHIERVLEKLELVSYKTELIDILSDNGLSVQLFTDKAMKTIFDMGYARLVYILTGCGVQFSSSILEIDGDVLLSDGRKRNILELLLYEEKVNESYCNNDILRLACRYKYPLLVKLLLSRKEIDASFDNNICLIDACKRYQVYPVGYDSDESKAIEIVKLLLACKKVDPAARKKQLFLTAIKSGYFKVVKILSSDKRVNPLDRNSGYLRRVRYKKNWNL